MKRSFSLIGPLCLILILVGIDQATKAWILEIFTHTPHPRPIMPILQLVLVWNRGISWGWFNNAGAYNGLIFGGFAALMSVLLAIWLWRSDRLRTAYGFALIISGAVGNLIDRLKYGGVVDFLSFHWGHFTFPAFNVADAAITLGALVILVDEFLINKRTKAHAL